MTLTKSPYGCSAFIPQSSSALFTKTEGARRHGHPSRRCNPPGHPTSKPKIQRAPPPPTSKPKIHDGPPPTQDKKPEAKLGMITPVVVMGSLLSVLSSASPFVVYWSSGSNYEAIRIFYSKADLFSTGITILSWLMFSLCQRHESYGKTLGWGPIVVYSIGLVIFIILLVMRWCSNGTVNEKMCHLTMGIILGITLLLLLIDMFKPIKREQRLATCISFVAAVFQLTTQFLPYPGMYALYCGDPTPANQPHAPDQPQAPALPPVIKNKRKLIIFTRAVDAAVTLFWAVYYAYNYDNSLFWFANVTSAVLSWGSAYFYISWGLRPVAGHQAQAEEAHQ